MGEEQFWDREGLGNAEHDVAIRGHVRVTCL